MAQSLAALSLGDAEIRQINGLYSLNDLHTAAGGERRHRPGYFLSGSQSKELIAAIETAGNPAVRSEEGCNGGTYACRELVIAYAAWISAAFHLRVIRVFLAAAPAPASVQADAQALAVAHTRAIEAAQAAAARVRRSVYRAMQQTQPGATLRMLVEVYPDESGDPHITARRLREGEEVLTPAELADHVRRARVDELRRIVATLGAGLPDTGDNDTATPTTALTVRR